MKILTQADLVRQIDDFLERHAMKPSRLAREATGEPGLIDAIREGRRSPTLNTVEKLASFMRKVDEEAATRAKLAAPLELAVEEEEIPLPFGKAPVNHTGASSETCSSTLERRHTQAGSENSRSSGSSRTRDGASAPPNGG